MKKQALITLILFAALCQMLPANAQSRYQLSEEIMQAVIVPCTEVAAGGDPANIQKYLDGAEDSIDRLVKAIQNIAKHTKSKHDRLAGYVVWKNFCIVSMSK